MKRQWWTNACQGDLKRAYAIYVLMEQHPDLMAWLFCEGQPELQASPEEILNRASALSADEGILIRLALDLWSGNGGTQVVDLKRLDPGNFKSALAAIQHIRDV